MTPYSEKPGHKETRRAPERDDALTSECDDALTSECDEYRKGLSELMSEWASPEDEEAWRDL